MPDHEPIMPDDEPNMFDRIERWIPEDLRAEYRRFTRDVRHLEPDDPIMRCILAMGIFTVVIQQAPAAIVGPLSEFQQTVGSLLAALDERAASLQKLHENVVSPAHLERVAKYITQQLEKLIGLYLHPLAKDKALALREKTQMLDQWLDRLTSKAQVTIREFNNVSPAIEQQLAKLEKVHLTLQKSLERSVTERVRLERSGQPWRWVLATVAAFIAVGLFGFWVGRNWDAHGRPTTSSVQSMADHWIATHKTQGNERAGRKPASDLLGLGAIFNVDRA